jgi:hypothetical protein
VEEYGQDWCGMRKVQRSGVRTGFVRYEEGTAQWSTDRIGAV